MEILCNFRFWGKYLTDWLADVHMMVRIMLNFETDPLSYDANENDMESELAPCAAWDIDLGWSG